MNQLENRMVHKVFEYWYLYLQGGASKSVSIKEPREIIKSVLKRVNTYGHP